VARVGKSPGADAPPTAGKSPGVAAPAGAVTPAGDKPASKGSRRVIFIDLARALAVLFMLYGHALDALLDPRFRTGTWFDVWTFQRGLTSCLFLLLSGFAFSIATARHWTLHIAPSMAILRRAKRFALFVMLGYALHFPVTRVVEFRHVDPERWRLFLAVDVLQLIGVTFFAVQLLVMLTRSRRAFMVATLVLAVVLVGLTPTLWAIDWTRWLPLAMAGYFSERTGSLFPLLPWSAYILVGASLGQIYAHWGAADLRRYANAALLLPAAILIGAGIALDASHVFGTGGWSFIPPQFLIRTGSCLVVMGVMAHGSARLSHLPHLFGAVAQETLLIYFVHLLIVYGSIWNVGLVQRFGPTLGPGRMVTVIALLIGSMAGLASFWNWCKHSRPRLARATVIVVWVLLIYRLA
jgi:uncharacterized membrane protein